MQAAERVVKGFRVQVEERTIEMPVVFKVHHALVEERVCARPQPHLQICFVSTALP